MMTDFTDVSVMPLGIGVETVKSYVKSIFLKLDSPSSAAAAGRAYELGILRP